MDYYLGSSRFYFFFLRQDNQTLLRTLLLIILFKDMDFDVEDDDETHLDFLIRDSQKFIRRAL